MELWEVVKKMSDGYYKEGDRFTLYHLGIPLKKAFIDDKGKLWSMVLNSEDEWVKELPIIISTQTEYEWHSDKNEYDVILREKLSKVGVKIYNSKPGDGRYSSILNSKKEI